MTTEGDTDENADDENAVEENTDDSADEEKPVPVFEIGGRRVGMTIYNTSTRDFSEAYDEQTKTID